MSAFQIGTQVRVPSPVPFRRAGAGRWVAQAVSAGIYSRAGLVR